MARTATLVPSAFLREARFVSEVGHLSDSDIARATGAAPSTARAWLAGTRAPTGERAERLVELSALVERLTRVIDPSYIAVWLRKPRCSWMMACCSREEQQRAIACADDCRSSGALATRLVSSSCPSVRARTAERRGGGPRLRSRSWRVSRSVCSAAQLDHVAVGVDDVVPGSSVDLKGALREDASSRLDVTQSRR